MDFDFIFDCLRIRRKKIRWWFWWWWFIKIKKSSAAVNGKDFIQNCLVPIIQTFFVIILKQKTLCEAVTLDIVYCLFLQIKRIVLVVNRTNTQQMNEPYTVQHTVQCSAFYIYLSKWSCVIAYVLIINPVYLHMWPLALLECCTNS